MRPPRTVLVVDDDERNRALLQARLERSYAVRRASSGDAALEALETGPVDLVLLDVMMPGLSGYEVCRRIKATRRSPFLPVVLVTALGEQADRNEGLEAGADDFLTKPVDPVELMLRVGALLRLRDQEETILGRIEEVRRLSGLRDDLISLVVHDLRNPLASILTVLQILSEEVPDPTSRQDVELALRAGARLRETVDDMLDIRMIEEGQFRIVRVPTALGALAREAVGTLEGAARERSVTLSVDDSGAPALDVDRKLVRRALENLLANAVRYSPAGGVVEVAVRSAPAGAVFEVMDRGPGIRDDMKPLLFTKFGSVEVKSGSLRRGYGLGLYLVGLVASAHGGATEACDRPGGGTVLRLLLGAP